MPFFNPTPNKFFAWLFTTAQDPAVEQKLQSCRDQIVAMFNAMLLHGAEPPKEWAFAEIVCLFKTGDPDDPGNYRPVALLAAFSKLFTAILTKRLSDFVEANNGILSETQRGGRPDMSTYQLISTILSIMSVAKATNKTLWILFLDLKKAFNSVPFWAVETVLRDMKVPETFIQATMNLYKNLKSRIRLKDILSELYDEERGVRQGDTLSPLLWILFLNPLLLFWKYKGIGFKHKTEHAFHLNTMVQAATTDVSFVDDMAVFITSAAMLTKATTISSDFFVYYGIEIGIKGLDVILIARTAR